MSTRIVTAVALAIGASFLLTACDPPMPPEVRAALAEQSYTCETGDTQLAAIAPIAAVAGDWQASIESNCPGMTITPATKNADAAELQIGTTPKNAAYATVPFAVDAVVIAVSLADVTNVNLSAEAIEDIWSGKITAWDDPTLAKLNSGFTMPATKISFGNELTADQTKPLSDWLSRIGGSGATLSAGTMKLSTLTEGGLVITTYSNAMTAGIPMVGIVAPGKTEGVVPEVGSINAAASMYKTKATDSAVELTFDSNAKPIAPEGVDKAPAPYQAVSIVDLKLTGTDSLKTRAAARYILRQDSQGSLGLSTVVPLPENLRIAGLTLVSKGLPEPKITATPSQ